MTSPTPAEKERFILSKYGEIYPIGVCEFSNEIIKSDSLINNQDDNHHIPYKLQSLSKYDITEPHDISIRDHDIENMLAYGVIDERLIDEFMLGNIKTPFLIKREQVETIIKYIHNEQNIVIYGALGNGKSILIKQLKPVLASSGFQVFELDDSDADYTSDIDYLSKTNDNNIIFIDNYERYLPVIEYVSTSSPKNIRLILSGRISEHEYGRRKLASYNFNYSEFNVDILSDSEILEFVEIMNNLGAWGENAGISLNDKKNIIKNEHDAQLSITLLVILESPQIKGKLDDVMRHVITSQRSQTIFSICLCNILNIPLTRSIISDLSNSDEIYSPYYTTDDKFKLIFKTLDSGQFIACSSLFSIFIIKNYFSATNVTKYLLSIATTFEKLRFNGKIEEQIFKSMLKFSFIERIMPANTKLGNMQSYYEQLKTYIKWLTNDPHFWLQYAMCYLAFHDFPTAQKRLDEAYNIAWKKTNYHTFNIDTQQAKLLLISTKNILDGNVAFDHFQRADSLLNGTPTEIYKIRQLLNYDVFYKDSYIKLSKKHKQLFHALCKKTLDDINKIMEDKDSGISMTILSKTQMLFNKLSMQL
ncbi:P-loop NTPase [Aeromonas sp. 95A]|uniref:P-loop NTPase n=1 Tax=Aeromonas sp. 95A TaxID=3452729 RepID=UPI003F799FCA